MANIRFSLIYPQYWTFNFDLIISILFNEIKISSWKIFFSKEYNVFSKLFSELKEQGNMNNSNQHIFGF